MAVTMTAPSIAVDFDLIGPLLGSRLDFIHCIQ
jgi:hypothetical protein